MRESKLTLSVLTCSIGKARLCGVRDSRTLNSILHDTARPLMDKIILYWRKEKEGSEVSPGLPYSMSTDKAGWAPGN